MHNKQRKLQQPECLHNVICLLFSCLVLAAECQAILATPIATKIATTSTLSAAAASASASATSTTRLRIHEKSKGRGGAKEGADVFKFSRFSGTEGTRSAGSTLCAHKSLSELIKTSPVILKALGAHIFNHDDDEDLRILHNSNDALLLKWQNEQNKVLTSLKRAQKLQKFSPSSSSSTITKTAEITRQQPNTQKQQQTFSDAATNRAAMLASMNADAILITLTPETIYKGASMLKMTPSTAERATLHGTSSSTNNYNGNNNLSSSGGSGSNSNSNSIDSNNGNSASSGYNSGTINSSEASYLYEGRYEMFSHEIYLSNSQLNASVQPLSCFDENLLKMLPSNLIIFGKLITIEDEQRQHDDLLMNIHDYTSSSSSSTSSEHRPQQQMAKDVLKISINGLHRWSSQFENYIWKHLGWDDWSDFTVCSVPCGKGVQQRFRRCLLDNPMVNLNMNFNNGDELSDDDVDVDADVVVEVEEEMDVQGDDGDDVMIVDDDADNDDDDDDHDDELNEQHKTLDKVSSKSYLKAVENRINENIAAKKEVVEVVKAITTADVNQRSHTNSNVLFKADAAIASNMLNFITTTQTEITVENSTTEEPEVMRIFEGHFSDTFSEKIPPKPVIPTSNNEKSFNSQLSTATAGDVLTSLKNKTDTRKLKNQQQHKNKHKKHKSAKLYSTMFCEGYNIEQRNCNSFECSDDINDLLKFYRKYPTGDETNTAATQQQMMMDWNTMAAAAASLSYSTISGSATASPPSSASASASSASSPSLSSFAMNGEIDGTETNNQNGNIFTTPINMGYVQNWHNTLNFTIMLTLRLKNDSYTTATIFSIRNSTHNLYLESCKDGLRLFLERDKTTEMLPIKFNLYDYHWHQVAISIQNGDFISIHVDCSWTNSFVVSKRLFSLPITADVEIGRGFSGELQQLLILPEHQERLQCSEKRTSINEVKRYIIDTFIDDYGN